MEKEQLEHVTTPTSSESPSASSVSMHKKLSVKTILKIALRVVIFAWAGWFISYSIEQYNAEDGAEGIFVCNETECFRTVHIHADIEFDLCWKKVVLPRETWPLDGLHTHKEKNYLHFHDRLDLDPETHQAFFDQRLSIPEVIGVFNLKAEEYCETSNVKTIVYLNDEVLENREEYNRKDGDKLHIEYIR